MNFAVVDDDEVFRLSTKMMLRSMNESHEALMFVNGKEVIDYLLENAEDPGRLPDVILLDLDMPIMDGWDFLETYLPVKSQLAKDISIYIVTSSIDDADRKRAKAISAVKGYWIKPISRKNLRDLLKTLD